MNLTLSTLPHTWILDLDGTLVIHNGYKIYGYDIFLNGAKEFLQSIPEIDTIIFITSRELKYKHMTETFLQQHHIAFNLILYEMPYGERILVNDDKPMGLNMCHAVKVKRNDNWTLSFNIDNSL